MIFLRIRTPVLYRSQKQLEQNSSQWRDKEFRELVDEAHATGIYVIDGSLLLNLAGDLFNYVKGMQDTREYNPQSEYKIFWRNQDGVPQSAWTDIENVDWVFLYTPTKVCGLKSCKQDEYFRRKGGDGNRRRFSRKTEKQSLPLTIWIRGIERALPRSKLT